MSVHAPPDSSLETVYLETSACLARSSCDQYRRDRADLTSTAMFAAIVTAARSAGLMSARVKGPSGHWSTLAYELGGRVAGTCET